MVKHGLERDLFIVIQSKNFPFYYTSDFVFLLDYFAKMSKTTAKPEEEKKSILNKIITFIREPSLYFCQNIIFGPTGFKLIVAFVIIIIGSLLKRYDLVPQSYFSVKTNIFNRYFAKLGWGWTIGLLGPFIYLTLMTTRTTKEIVANHLSRLLVATGIWLVVTSLFVFIESRTGTCNHQGFQGATRYVCLKGGHKWDEGIDFSGHTFLLLYAILIINEEVKAYRKGVKKIDKTEQQTSEVTPDGTTNPTKETFQIYQHLIRVVYIALGVLTVLWEFMLLSTALYFHHTLHKIAAGICAVFFWYNTYYVWYQPRSTSLLCPAKPEI